jgi:hypothetical protein
MDWERLLSKTAKAPWVPEITGPGDTSNFEDFDEEEECDEVMPYTDNGIDWDKDF